MATYCPQCATVVAFGNEICHRCGWRMDGKQNDPYIEFERTYRRERNAAVLCYFFVPAVYYLVIDPYRKNQLVRFHAMQSVGYVCLWLLFFILTGSLGLSGVVLRFLLAYPAFILAVLAGLHIFLMYKAFKRERFQLPIIGAMAESQSRLYTDRDYE